MSHKRLAKYIGRYVRHPTLANSRIDRYNGEVVRFFYEDHEGTIRRKVMTVEEFISAIIQHVPEKHFRLVRYYGAYARRKKAMVKAFIQQSIIRQQTIVSFREKRTFLCPRYKEPMETVLYCEKPPPKDREKITTWLEEQRRH